MTVYLSEPAQISRIFIKQLRNEGLIKVETLAWTGVKGVVGAATTVFDIRRTTPNGVCLSVQSVRIGPAKSAIRKPVPVNGTQVRAASNVADRLVRLQLSGVAIQFRDSRSTQHSKSLWLSASRSVFVLQAAVDPSLNAVGGIRLTMDRTVFDANGQATTQQGGVNYGPFVEWVQYAGRILYPVDSSKYLDQDAKNRRKK